jgi:hypothetical protein
MRALERRAQMGDDLSVPGYGDVLALLRLADKLGELVFCLGDGISGHSSPSRVFWLSTARIA